MARSHISSPNCRSRRPNRYTRPDQVVPLFPRTTSAPGPSGCRCPLQWLRRSGAHLAMCQHGKWRFSRAG